MLVLRKKLKGSILGFSVMLLSLFLFTGITLVSVAVFERKSSFTTQKSVIAFQAADSGAERILKRIYIDNSPSIATVALNSSMPTNATLNSFASDMNTESRATVTGAACASGVITATNSPASSPGYTFAITFYAEGGLTVGCSDADWRDKMIRIRSIGTYQRASRVVEIGIRPRT